MVSDGRSEHTRLLSSKPSSAYAPRFDHGLLAVSQELFTACASSPSALRTPSGSSVGIASKPAAIWAKI